MLFGFLYSFCQKSWENKRQHGFTVHDQISLMQVQTSSQKKHFVSCFYWWLHAISTVNCRETRCVAGRTRILVCVFYSNKSLTYLLVCYWSWCAERCNGVLRRLLFPGNSMVWCRLFAGRRCARDPAWRHQLCWRHREICTSGVSILQPKHA